MGGTKRVKYGIKKYGKPSWPSTQWWNGGYWNVYEHACLYETRQEAEELAFRLTIRHPDWTGRLEVEEVQCSPY